MDQQSTVSHSGQDGQEQDPNICRLKQHGIYLQE